MFAALARRHGGQLSREQTVALLASVGLGEGGEHVELLWSEMGLAPNAFITQVRNGAVSAAVHWVEVWMTCLQETTAVAGITLQIAQLEKLSASAFCCRKTGSA